MEEQLAQIERQVSELRSRAISELSYDDVEYHQPAPRRIVYTNNQKQQQQQQQQQQQVHYNLRSVSVIHQVGVCLL